MGRRRIAYFINGFHGGIDCRIKADRVFRAGNVEVDRPRNADDVDPFFCQLSGAAVGAVAADDNKSVDAEFAAVGSRFFDAFRRIEFRAARGVKHCATQLNDVRHAAKIHFDDVFMQQAVVSSVYTKHLDAGGNRGTGNRTDRSIHARSVSAARQHSDFFDSHGKTDLLLLNSHQTL